MTPYAFPAQMPIVFLVPLTHYDFMNPTTTNPFTTLDSSSTKISRPSYVAIPLYAIIPFHTIQVQTPPPQSVPSPHSLDSAFWDVVIRTAEYSLRGAAALGWLFSSFPEAVSRKVRIFFCSLSRSESHSVLYSQEPSPLRDNRRLPSYDPFDSLPSIPGEDLLRVDVSGLESIPFSELYLEEEDVMTTAPAAPRLVRLVQLIRPHQIANSTPILVSGRPTTSAIKFFQPDSSHPP